MKEHVNIEHLDRRIRCGCGQEFKWRSAFARHKAKCLLAQYSVTDPNPQKRTSRANRKSDLSQPSKPNPKVSQTNATNDSLGRPDTSSTNTTVVTMESQRQFSKPPMMTNVTTQSAINTKFSPNSGTSAETAVMIRKYTDLVSTTKDKHASTITTTNQQIQSSRFGVNQQRANSRSLTKSIDTGGSVDFVISETPSSSNQTPGDGWNKYTKYNNRVAPPRICFGTVACKSSFTNFASICKCWVTRNNKRGCHIYVKDRKPGNKAAFHIKSKHSTFEHSND